MGFKKARNLISRVGKNRFKNAVIIFIIAIIMFLATFTVQSAIGSMVYVSESKQITDWEYVSGTSDKAVTDRFAVFKQANSVTKINVSSKTPYMHLRYTFEHSDKQRHLIINANHSPIKATIGSKVIYNNGYGYEEVVGNNFNEIIIPASQFRETIHIYTYAPFSYTFDAELNNGESVVNIQLFVALVVMALGLAYIIVAVCLAKGGIIKMVSLASGLLSCGILMLISSVSSSTSFLNDPIWFNISIAINMIVSLISIINILLLIGHHSSTTNTLCIIILVLAVLSVFAPQGILFNSLMFIFCIVQAVLMCFMLVAMQKENIRFKKGTMLLQVASTYLFIINIFNSLALVFGAFNIAKTVFVLGIVVLNLISSAYYIKFVAIGNVLNDNKQKELEYQAEFYSELSEIVTSLYAQTTSEQFISFFISKVIPIIENNEEIIIDPDYPLTYAIAVKNENGYNIIKSTAVEAPNFFILNEYLGDKNFLIGENYIGVRFRTNDTNAVFGYISNVKVPKKSTFRNYFNSLCLSAQSSFVNHALRFELFNVEEKMFINLSGIVDERSKETSNHLTNVSLMTNILCKTMGYNKEQSKLIATAAMTHDIGKIAIPDAILNKEGIYTEEEREIMKRHTWYGYNILSVSKGRFFEIAAKIAKEHHENYDGTGYMHLKGEEIDKFARIVRVVDAFDALISKRCYKEAWDVNEAIDYIISNSGKIFDPEVVRAFEKCKNLMIEVRQ